MSADALALGDRDDSGDLEQYAAGMVNALSLAPGDADANGRKELFVGASNNQVYRVFLDRALGRGPQRH